MDKILTLKEIESHAAALIALNNECGRHPAIFDNDLSIYEEYGFSKEEIKNRQHPDDYHPADTWILEPGSGLIESFSGIETLAANLHIHDLNDYTRREYGRNLRHYLGLSRGAAKVRPANKKKIIALARKLCGSRSKWSRGVQRYISDIIGRRGSEPLTHRRGQRPARLFQRLKQAA